MDENAGNLEVFTTQMRKATRELHAISDAMVNAKLLVALSDNSVWADGLLIFYEIFRFLETAIVKHKDKQLGKLCVDGMFRTAAFESDLSHYLGNNWKRSYVVRDAVSKYLSHLEKLNETDPDLLMAYVYHLYMGLLSGGQILRKKRTLEGKLFMSGSSNVGEAVTDFGSLNIRDIKRDLKSIMNAIASELDEETKLQLIEESKHVFVLNNSIIKTVQGTNRVVVQKFLYVMLLALSVYILTLYFKAK